MIIMIDNYDSFSYNLFQLIGSYEPDIRVLRNDEYSVSEIEAMQPAAVVLSPGPGKPADAGICVELVQALSGRFPILGVCLGHQAIIEAFGGEVSYAKELMHGKRKRIRRQGESRILQGLEPVFEAARYHSLVGTRIPEQLIVTAVSDDENQEVMAVEHKDAAVFGLQFHPESVMTPDGSQIIRNFLACVQEGSERK